MEHHWWKPDVSCKCGKEPKIIEFLFSAEGEICLIYMCSKCKETINWRVFTSQLQMRGLCNDIRTVPQIKRKQLPPPRELSEEDKKFLRDTKIDPGGGGAK